MNRRSFLCRIGAVGLGGLAGCPDGGNGGETDTDTTVATPTDSPGPVTGSTPGRTPGEPLTDEPPSLRDLARVPADANVEFEHVHDVRDLGADPTGERPINPVLEDHIQEGTLFVFPEGRYSLSPFIKTGLRNVGFVSRVDNRPTLVPAGPVEETGEWLVALKGENLLVNGFDLDYTSPGHGARIQLFASRGNFWCRDLHIYGQIDSYADAFAFKVLDSDGVGVVERLVARDGSPGNTGPTSGIFVGLEHSGTIRIVDCEMWHFPGKGIYGSNPAERATGAGGGIVHVEGGHYRNNNIGNIRVGGGATIKDVTFEMIDSLEGGTVEWETPLPRRRDIINARSLRVKGDRNGRVVVENCEFRHESGGGSGVVVVTPTGSVTLRNCEITHDSGPLPTVHLKPDITSLDPSRFENVTIAGESSDAPGVLVRENNGASFDDCSITLPNTDGFRLTPDSSVRLKRCSVDVGGLAVTFMGEDPDGSHSVIFLNGASETFRNYGLSLTQCEDDGGSDASTDVDVADDPYLSRALGRSVTVPCGVAELNADSNVIVLISG